MFLRNTQLRPAEMTMGYHVMEWNTYVTSLAAFCHGKQPPESIRDSSEGAQQRSG